MWGVDSICVYVVPHSRFGPRYAVLMLTRWVSRGGPTGAAPPLQSKTAHHSLSDARRRQPISPCSSNRTSTDWAARLRSRSLQEVADTGRKSVGAPFELTALEGGMTAMEVLLPGPPGFVIDLHAMKASDWVRTWVSSWEDTTVLASTCMPCHDGGQGLMLWGRSSCLGWDISYKVKAHNCPIELYNQAHVLTMFAGDRAARPLGCRRAHRTAQGALPWHEHFSRDCTAPVPAAAQNRGD